MQTLPLATQVANLARRQHGLVTRAQLVNEGFGDRRIESWCTAGRIERVLPGVFRLPGVPASREQTFHAAVLWGGPDSVASHRAAAELWGFDGPKAAKPEITVPLARIKKSKLVVVHQTRGPTTPRRTRHGIPVTTPERTIIDLAGVVTAEALEIAFESARRERWVTVESVSGTLTRIGTRGRDGTQQLQGLLAILGNEPPAESALEVLTARVVRASGLPKPQRQVEIDANGSDFRLDFAWPRELVALECDGHKRHEPAFEHDRRRWSAIQASTGYHIVWATWQSITEEPDLIVAELQQMLARAA